jgi:hypothetical protein
VVGPEEFNSGAGFPAIPLLDIQGAGRIDGKGVMADDLDYQALLREDADRICDHGTTCCIE